MNFQQIKSNPFFYSKQSLPSVNLKSLAIYHPRHTTQTTDLFEAKLFPTAVQQSQDNGRRGMPSLPSLMSLATLPSDEPDRENLSFQIRQPPAPPPAMTKPKSFSNVAQLKKICKTEATANYQLEHHLRYLEKRAPQRHIGQLVNKVNHAQLEKYHHLFEEIQKNNPHEKVPVESMQQFITNIQNSTLKYTKSPDKSKLIVAEISSIEAQEQQKHLRQIELNDSLRKRKQTQGEEILPSNRSQYSQQHSNSNKLSNSNRISNFYMHHNPAAPKKIKLAEVIKRLSLQVNKLQHELPKDPSFQNKFDSLQFFFTNLYVCLEKIMKEKRNWASVIVKTNGFNSQIKQFLFEVNTQHGHITGLKYLSGQQMFDHFIQAEFPHKFSHVNHNGQDVLQHLSESPLLKKLIYFSTQLEEHLVQKIRLQLNHDVMQKEMLQTSVVKMLKFVRDEDEYQKCKPIAFQTAGRSLRTQLEEISKKHQNLNGIDKFAIIDAEVLDQNEKTTAQIRNIVY